MIRHNTKKVGLRLIAATLVVAGIFAACDQRILVRKKPEGEPEVTGSITVNLATEVTGTLAASSLGDQTANAVIAGPTSGSAAAPTWRYLTAADMPATVVAATVTSAGSLYYSTSGGAASTALPDVATGQVLASGGVGAAPAYTANPTLNSVVVATTVADSSGDGLKNDVGTGYVGLMTGNVVRFRCAGAICGVPDEGASTTSFSFSGTTGAATSARANITTGTAQGLLIANPTASTSGVPVQRSPTEILKGRGWTGAADQALEVYLQAIPVSGTNPITGKLSIGTDVGSSGTVTERMSVDTSGNLACTSVTASTAGPDADSQHTLPNVAASTVVVAGTLPPSTWAAHDVGVAGEGTNFLGPFRSVGSSGKFRNVACSWSVAGTGGTTGVVVQVYNVSGGAEVCACTLGACTTTARDPLVCDCNTSFSSGTTYAVRLKSTTDCTLNPADVACVVEIAQ